MAFSAPEQDVDILGCQIRLTPHEEEREIAQKVLSEVHSAISAVRLKKPSLTSVEVAVLVALQFASEKVKMEEDFKGSLDFFETSLVKAMGIINNQQS
jgi:cell division protein ZapA (FtsZ GTPase activity inhibitor)